MDYFDNLDCNEVILAILFWGVQIRKLGSKSAVMGIFW